VILAIRRQQSSGEFGSLDSTQGGTRFLRERLLLICKVFAFIDVIYFALFSLAVSLDSNANYLEVFAESLSLETLGEYALFAAVWIACRLFGESLRLLRALDATLLLGLGCLWSTWCFIHPYPALGAYEMVLALVGVPVLRAVLIPSTGVRTFALTSVACVPGLIASFVASTLRDSMMAPLTLTVLVLNWCSLSVVFSTVASSVVFGLRSEVRRARRFGQYTLIAKLGEGSMGVVFLAQHALLRRRTAIKLIGGDASARAINRFEREVQLTSQLTHPNTIAIYDFGRTEDGAFYYAMEHLDGADLQGIVELTGPCDPGRVIHILRQACGALEEAHARGLLHRDIKPSNLFLCPRRGPADVVKILDFGLVKDLSGSDATGSSTHVDTLLGTPLYMSPESISDPQRVDERSDIYALGAVTHYQAHGAPGAAGPRSHRLTLPRKELGCPLRRREVSARCSRRLPRCAELDRVSCRALVGPPRCGTANRASTGRRQLAAHDRGRSAASTRPTVATLRPISDDVVSAMPQFRRPSRAPLKSSRVESP
jgi:serine/threonine protein kinase